MRIALAPHGTRGDVQPLLALGLALQQRGHEIVFAVSRDFRAWIESFGFRCRTFDFDVRGVLVANRGRMADVRWQMRHLREELLPRQFRFLAEALSDADCVVGAGIQLAAPAVCERRRVPYVAATYAPCVLPNSHEAPPTPFRRLPRPLIRLAWAIGTGATDLSLYGPLNHGRKALGLQPVLRPARRLMAAGRFLLAADRELAPPPPSLPPGVIVTDAWTLEEAARLDPALDAFLEAGDPPVYAGFGSMTTKDPARLTATVLDAAAQAGCRLVLARGWTGLGGSAALPHWCHIVDETPHHLLFPRMRAVVHHGGAGTTTAAARAGVPQIVVPHVLDQFYWAERVRKLGLGPEPVAANQVAVKGLAERLRAAPSFGPRAAGFGRGIRGRDGVEAAAGAIEAIAGGEPLGMGPYFSLGSSR